MLSAVVFLPLAGALVIALILRGDRLVRWFAVAVTLADLALAGVVFGMYFQDREGFRLVEQHSWIEPLNIQYLMAVDGLSAPLVLLTGLLGMSAAFVSWGIKTRVREYFVWLLVLQTAVMGVFVPLDLIDTDPGWSCSVWLSRAH